MTLTDEMKAEYRAKSIHAIDEDQEFLHEALREEVALLQRKDNVLRLDKVFPPELYEALVGVSKTIPCHPDGVAALLLGVAASILGSKHRIHAFHGYYEKFILQVCLLLDAGCRKSAQLKLVADPIWELDKADREAYAKAIKGADKDTLASIPKPRERVQIDFTPEGLIKKLSEPQNANGILRRVDELSSLFKGLTQYNQGNGLETELRYWDGQPIKQTRVNDGADRIIDSPHVSTVSTSQPKVITGLIESLGGLNDSANGLWGRYLFVRPPYRDNKAYRGEDGIFLHDAFARQIEHLYSNLDNLAGKTWKPTHEAREAFFDVNDYWTEKVQGARSSFMENTYMKAIGHTIRIAGVIAAIRIASDAGAPWVPTDPYDAIIELDDVRAAREVMEYFVQQSAALIVENVDHKSVTSQLHNSSQLKQLAAWVKRKQPGMIIAARDIQRANLTEFKALDAKAIREIFKLAAEMFPDTYELIVDGGHYKLQLK
jgi:hypothetical protein